jgi:SAM-dependent methyltransferase
VADVTPPRFDRLAPHYRWLERLTYGDRLQRCRVALLGEVTDARRVLVLGEGDGRFLAAFLAANRVATVEVIDGSPAMVALARRRIGDMAGRVTFRVADARDFAPAGPFDLVVTNFFLDCLPDGQLGPLVARLAPLLAPGGRWLVGDFRVPDRGRLRQLAARVALGGMYAAFRAVTRLPAGRLADPRPHLRAAGLTPGAVAPSLGGFLVAELWHAGADGRPT